MNRYLYLCGTIMCATAAQAESSKPNIVIIFADDMGYGDMSCQNPDSKIQTPNIDMLASQGIRFTDGHSSSGISSPSRYALLTGNYHWRRMHNIVPAYGESVFKPNEMTLPKMLSENGYYTALIGKWHLGWDWSKMLTPEGVARKELYGGKVSSKYQITDFDWTRTFTGGPCDRGFDYYFGDGTINFPPYCWIERDRVVEAPTEMLKDGSNGALEGKGELRLGPTVKGWDVTKVLPTITDKTIEVIENLDKERPFFLMLSLTAPHAPIVPTEEFHGRSGAGYYGDFVVQCDDIVSRVVTSLKERGLYENTIIIFTADNGAESYAFERIENFDHNSTAPLRGLKRDTWEGGHRVPFIISWNGVTKTDVSDEIINQVDLMATFADIIGYELPQGSANDSYSLLPLLLGDRYKSPIREATVQNTFEDRFAIRQGDWVLIDSYSGSHSKSPDSYNERYGYREYTEDEKSYLLYNLKSDLKQQNDLSERHPKVVAKLQALLKEYRESGKSVNR